MKIYDVIITGAGPAGISCAIQLKRYGINFLIFEKNKVGGLLLNANCVENYPGFPEGIEGEKLVEKFTKHLKFLKIKVKNQEVVECDFDKKNRVFSVKTKNKEYFSKFLVIASGTKPKKVKYKGIKRIPEKKIFYEVYNLKNLTFKEIAIVGAGDAAFDYALNLSKKNRVYILNRTEKIKSLPLLVERARREKSIKYLDNTLIEELLWKDGKINVICKRKGNLLKLKTDFLLFATGRKPELDFLSKGMEKNRRKLEKEGFLYLAGDVKRGIYRQTAISCGDGIISAMRIYERIKNENNR